MPKIRVLQECAHPVIGCGPLLPGVYEASIDPISGRATVDHWTLLPDAFEIVPEPHEFSPERWADIVNGIYLYQREPGRKAFRGVAIKSIG